MEVRRYKKTARFPIAAVGLSTAAFITIKTVRDALCFTQTELQELPLAFMWIALASLPAGLLH